MSKKHNAIIAHVRFNFAQCVFNHQVFEFATKREKRKEKTLKIINLAFTAFSLAAVVDHGQTFWLNVVGQYAIVAEITLQLAQWTFGIGSLSLKHEQAAKEYLALREEYRCLLAEFNTSQSITVKLKNQYYSLVHKYNAISKTAPQTTDRDYKNARKKLGLSNKKSSQSEAYTWSNEEIDNFLS